jgi:hypothetical protein
MKQCIKCDSKETAKWYSGPVCRSCYRKTLYQNPSEKTKVKLKNKKWRDANKEYCFQKNKEWKESNRQVYLQYLKKWREQNKEKILIGAREYYKVNYATNTEYKLARTIRSRIKIALNKGYKRGTCIDLLGCSITELKSHLESKFLPNMSWANYGLKGWHIDHIIPLSSFDLSNPEQLKKATHYANLQPLWAKDNLSKGNKHV